MKRKSIVISIVVVVLLCAMVWTLVNNKKEINSQMVVKTTEGRIAVSVESAQIRETSNHMELVGVTKPEREVVVASETSGKIVQINFKLGDSVNKGTVLAKVDDTYKRLSFETSQVNYDKAKADYERYQVLRQGDAVSEEQMRNLKITLENASIQLENTKKQLDDTKIVAPFSGVITSKNTELGAYVNAGTSIAGIADIVRLKIVLAVSESNVYQLSKGQEVRISTDVYPGVNYIGKISSISPQGSSAHTFPVEISITNDSKNSLKAGTYVNASVDMGESGKALMIPRDAIVSSIKDPSVYVVKNESVHLVKINAGLRYNSYLEVTSGISEGDQVVTNGQINLTDGAKISIIK